MPKLGLRPFLATLVLVPCAVASGLAFKKAHDRRVSVEQAGALDRMAQLAVVIGDLLHETQKERGTSSVFLSSKGAKFSAEVRAQRRLTDQVRLRFVELIEDQRAYWPSRVVAILELANSSLRDIESRRRQVSDFEISPAEEMAYYTDLNERLLDSLGSLVANTADVSLRGTTTAYLYFLHAKEKTGIERAQLSNVFGTDQFGAGQLALVAGLIASQSAYLNVFSKLAPPEVLTAYERDMETPVAAEVQKMEQVALSRAGGFGIDSALWFTTMSRKIDLLKGIEERLSAAVRDGARHVGDEARSTLIGAMVLALVMATMGILAALGLVASIVRPLQSLRAAIDRIAAGDFAVVVAPGGPSEIREIGEALAGMAESLAQMRSAPAPAVPAGTRSIASRLLLRRT
jgi:methyl-accepting chemotaxis protein